MDGILSKTYQPQPPVVELLTQSHQEAKSSKSTVTSITPTRYMPEAQSESPLLRAFTQQSVDEPIQEMAPSADQITNEELKKKRHSASEQRRRKKLSKLYTDIEHAVRDITPLINNPTRKKLLSACIFVAKKKTYPNHIPPKSKDIKTLKISANIELKEKRLIKNHKEFSRRNEIRQLINELSKHIPGTSYQKRNELTTLQNFLSFITGNPQLKTSKNQLNQNSSSRVKQGLSSGEKNGEKAEKKINVKTATFDSSQTLKESANSDNQVNSPLIKKTLQKPEEMEKTLEHSQPNWFAAPVSQFLEYELGCHEREQLKTTDEYPWDSLEATEGNHSPVIPCPYPPVPSGQEQNKQVQTYTCLPGHPPPDIGVYKPQTDSNEEPYPADDLSMMKAVAPQEIFQWTSCQQMEDNHSSSTSSSLVQPQTEGVPSSENEAIPFFFQQHRHEGIRAVPNQTWGKPSSGNEATPFGFQQLNPEEIEVALYDMAETLPLASTSAVLQIAPQNAPLISYLKNQVADLQMSQANLEHQQMQTRTVLNEVINKNLQLSKKVCNLENELEMLRTENAQLHHKKQLVENQMTFALQEEQQKLANLQRSQTTLERQQIQTQSLLDGARKENLQLSRKSVNLEQELEILQKKNELLQKKDQLSENLVKFAFQDEQKKVTDLEQKLRYLEAERSLMIDKISISDDKIHQLKETLKNSQPRKGKRGYNIS